MANLDVEALGGMVSALDDPGNEAKLAVFAKSLIVAMLEEVAESGEPVAVPTPEGNVLSWILRQVPPRGGVEDCSPPSGLADPFCFVVDVTTHGGKTVTTGCICIGSP